MSVSSINLKKPKNRPNKNTKGIIDKIKRDKYLYLLLLPSVIWYLLFHYKPIYGLVIAFQDFSLFKGILGSEWIGFENFETFFHSAYFLRNLRNTFLINIYSLIFSFPIPIILALLFNEVKNLKFRKGVQTIMYLPHFISTVIVVGIVTNFLSPESGIINLILNKFGFEKIYFLTRPEWFRKIYISMGIWKSAGFNSIIYLAALAGVNPQLYEAAVIDGASKWRQMLHVTLPGIMPTIIIMLILRIGNLLNVGFESIILLYQPVTYETADVISTYVYRTGIQQDNNYGLAAAAGLFNSVVSFVLVVSANKFSRKFSETSLW